MNAISPAKPIPFFRPNCGEQEAQAVAECIRGGWITTGPRVRQFEKEFARFVSVAEAVAVNSCTAAMHLALEAAGVRAGDEVIVPTLTFVATAQAAIYAGATPVLVDSDRDTLTISPCAIEQAVTSRTRAIIPMHYGGHACDLAAIGRIAKAHNLIVVEDAAHAINGHCRGTMVGASGNPTCFSFHATKPMTTGEGGMLTTPDEQLAERARLLRNHAIRRDAWARKETQDPWAYNVEGIGHKCNMPDIMAAIGLVQLRAVVAQHARRREVTRRYRAAFERRDDVMLQSVRPEVEHAFHLFPILLRLDMLRADRDTIMRGLLAMGVSTAIHYRPLHLYPDFVCHCRVGERCREASEWIFERLISLPLYSSLADESVDRIIESVTDLLKRYRR